MRVRDRARDPNTRRQYLEKKKNDEINYQYHCENFLQLDDFQ